MSYDQNQDRNQDSGPEYNRPNYDNPGYYGNPNTPYNSPGTPGSYEQSAPPYVPHNMPNPYENPGAPYGSTNAPYADAGAPYGAGIPPRAPLPLGEAIKGLPQQYIRAITRPGTAFFAEEQGKAAWNIVWVQVIILAIISALVSLVAFNTSLNSALTTSSAASQQMLQSFRASSGLFAILFLIFSPLAFFISVGIYHLIARAFGGRGTFLAYCYCYLLFGVPLSIISGLLSLIPILGSIVALGIGIYQIILQVFMTMAVHRLSGGKATLAVLILPIILIVLTIIVSIIIIVAIAVGAANR